MPSRIIKESICVSRKVNELTADEEVFFYRLLVNCDDYGCFYGDPMVLAGKMYPRRPCTVKSVRAWRDRVALVGLIEVYQVDGEEYIQVFNWNEHQRQRTMRRKYPPKGSPSNDGHLPADCGQMPDTRPRNAASPESNPIHSESESIPNPYKAPPAGSVLFLEALKAFKEMRTTSRKKLTAKAETMIRKKLEELAPGNETKQAAILNQSTMNGWAGVFPLREDTAAKAPAGRKPSNVGNFTQREYSDEYLDNLYDELPPVTDEYKAAMIAQGERLQAERGRGADDDTPPPEEGT